MRYNPTHPRVQQTSGELAWSGRESRSSQLVERLFFFLRRDSDLQQLMAMHAVSRRLKRLLLAWQPEHGV